MPETKVLPELRVILQRVSPGESAVSHDYPECVGLGTKLGGEPDWIQSPNVPTCSGCCAPMTFVAQIDSAEHQNELNPLSKDPIHEEQDYMFGDAGMIYVFFCFDCGETKSVFQCY